MFQKPHYALWNRLEITSGVSVVLSSMDVSRQKWDDLKSYVKPLVRQWLDRDKAFEDQDAKIVDKIVKKVSQRLASFSP